MLLVRVEPSKHAYYAGERVSVRIEFQTDQDGEEEKGRGFPRAHRHARKVSVITGVPTPADDDEKHAAPLQTIHERGDQVHITLATIRMTGHVVPSSIYIPPEPFLPLRQVLLHQPIGSGDSIPTTAVAPGTLDFSAGVDGTLAHSLGGLARGFLRGKEESTWEERRRSVWAGKALPVWLAGREVVCVDSRIGSGLVCEYASGGGYGLLRIVQPSVKTAFSLPSEYESTG